MLFAILVQGVRATFGMRRCGRGRDWHTHSDALALPQTKPDIHLKEQDTSLEACPLARVPGAGRDPVSALRALPTRIYPTTVIPAEARQREELEPRSHARRRLPPLVSGSRKRASGMTIRVRLKTA